MTVTVPLSVALAGMVRVPPLSVILPEGAALSATVVVEDTAAGSVALIVVLLPGPLSAMVRAAGTSDTLGLTRTIEHTDVPTGSVAPDCGVACTSCDHSPLTAPRTARMTKVYFQPFLRPHSVWVTVSRWLAEMFRYGYGPRPIHL